MEDDVRLKVAYSTDLYGPLGLRRMHEGDAGLDLRCTKAFGIGPHETRFVDCGIRIQLPPRTFGAIRSRSGLARKLGVHAIDGTVDENFAGPVGVTLVNDSDRWHGFEPGDRVAQLVVVPYVPACVERVDALDARGASGGTGYGSTGLA